MLSGAARPDRARRAMVAVEQYLVDREAGLIRLLSPPFDHASLEPGYIKGYVPGVRENGGQYTHAATWIVGAFAQLGDGQRHQIRLLLGRYAATFRSSDRPRAASRRTGELS